MVNKNTIPGDKNPPTVGSGIRLGTPAITSRGMKEEEMREIGQLISRVLQDPQNAGVISDAHKMVTGLTSKFSVRK